MGPDEMDEETVELRRDGMASDGSRLQVGDILEDGSTWYPGWPEPPEEMEEVGGGDD